ncbi:L,D-transpeptidase family protein [Aquipuribacter hungaricus]|uniref:L,D-transpeptidase family protein n=2 Tax=Aquipuribacter hungaricus TaxID=545624 RepID=A0ABV7WFT1_9MICO
MTAALLPRPSSVRRAVAAAGTALLAATLLVPAAAASGADPVPPAAPVTTQAAAPAAGVPVGSLAPGQQVADGSTRLVMQTDGNLVVYAGGAPAWHSRTDGHPGARLVVQGDGNLVVVGPDARPVWDSGTWGLGATDLRLVPGGLSLLLPSGRPVWRDGTWLAATVAAGQDVVPGEPVPSRDRSHRLVLQGDGNLVLYRGAVATWSSRTDGSGADVLRLQADGNLVLLDDGAPVWHTVTAGTAAARLVVQADGNTVLLGATRPVWDSRGATGAAAHHLRAGAVPSWALAVPDRTRQVLRAVPSTRWCSQRWCAVTELWRKASNGTWVQEAAYRSQSGPEGFSPMPRRAGDGTTPSGVYGIATTFSSHATPPGPMPWRRRLPTSTVSGSAAYYNTWIEEPGRTDGTRPSMEYGLWVDFNNARMVPGQGPAPDPRIGSGIFVHTLPATARYIASEGCIAIGERTQMLAVLQWLDPAAQPRVVLGT